ncbi:MAG: hypothetical protein DMF67_02400 [Acidobacteria bacterium]|nr:MAG: hypothetical protein DMF67_02400 [Acidobacteriota bacterium]
MLIRSVVTASHTPFLVEIFGRGVIACAAERESTLMLFIESKTAELSVEKSLRAHVLEALQERGLVPVIRASRLYFFEQALSGAEGVRELEQSVAEWSDREGDVPYVSGDVFCFDDCAHFLIFGGDADAGRGLLRAGVIYDAETGDPAGRLEAFCRNVQEALESAARSARGPRAQTGANGLDSMNVAWRPRESRVPEVFRRFAGEGGGEAAPSSAPRVGGAAERVRAAEILEDAAARGLLQRLSEAHADGRLAEMLSTEGRGPEQESLVARLAGAGLVRREIQVSCRKDGRSLFRLPSPDALTIVTASNAVCSECGAALADERAEELATPTPLASTLLKDGAWLLNNLRTILVELGVPERDIAARHAAEGEAQLMVNVCGEPFLFVLRDGDFTAAHARRALDGEAETHAPHVVIVATGKFQDEARARLREHARRRSRAGGETEVVFVEGLDAAPAELRRSIERVSQGALMRELYELDASAGFSVGYALAARFRLMQREGALQDLAASAAGAVAGSLREI